MKRLLWDYYGPDARGTAEHFVAHLGEFLRKNGLEAAPRGVMAEAHGHASAWVDVPDDEAERVTRALRPKRTLDRD